MANGANGGLERAIASELRRIVGERRGELSRKALDALVVVDPSDLSFDLARDDAPHAFTLLLLQNA